MLRTPTLVAWLTLALALPTAGQMPDIAATRTGFLKLLDRPRTPLAPESVERPNRGEEHFTYASEADQRVPGILVRPSMPGRRPVVVVLHGTGDRKESMLALIEPLVRRGFIGVTIDGRYHGERQLQPSDYDAAILEAYRTGHGHPFLYDTVWDLMRLIDYLQTRADVDPTRIGVIGISKGGMETYLAAAVDPRIAVAVPVISVQSFRWALDHNAWQPRAGTILQAITAAAREERLQRVDAAFLRRFYDRVVPGIYSDYDGPSMLPLIAPRPLLVINGDSDDLTPLAGVREAADAAERSYKAARAADRFSLLIQKDTGHELSPEAEQAAINWFVKWLKP